MWHEINTALFHNRFLQEYEKRNISLWGLTAQNEPTDGFFPHFPFQAMGWTPELQRDFIKLDLGPALHSAGFGHVQLMILDDQRVLLPYWSQIVSGGMQVCFACLTQSMLVV